MLLGEARVDPGLDLEALGEARLVEVLGVDVLADVTAGEEVDETGAAAVDDVGAGVDEGGGVT